MSAIERMGALLDERGVEYTVVHGYRECIWEFGESGIARASHIGTKGLVQMIVTGITPEQAIAATLGNGTCKVESMHGYTDAHAHTSWYVELSCHTLDAWEDSIPPSYCPICGRKVAHDGS